MYTPAKFKQGDLKRLHALMREHDFALLFTQTESGPQATHLPFLLDEARGPHGTLVAHMARANPHWKSFSAETEALVVFQGPHAYISTSWYAAEELVPTWNYAAVHAYGVPKLIHDPDKLLPMVQALLDAHEAPISGRRDLAPHRQRLLPELKAIVGFEIEIARLEGKWKFNQNRTRADQQGVVDALKDHADPVRREVAAIMQAHLDAPPKARA